MDFQDQKTGADKPSRNPNNYNILKGGQVDPGSKLYQRSIAGREQLKDYLNRLWNNGTDEADVFMAGVKSLMNRGHGYVGAYLDSKNPGRRYEKNQAMAITDQVMTDEGIGEHPGNRLTRPKVEDEEGNIDKEATKAARDKRKEANRGRGFGPQQAPGQKAMPVGQQRKQGKRTGSEKVAEDDTRRAGIDDPTKYEQPVRTGTGETEFYNVDKVRGVLENWKNGKASTEDVLAEFQKTYQKPLSDSPQADAERRQKRAESRDRYYTTGSGKMPEEEKKPASGGAQPLSGGAKPSGAQPPTSESKPPAGASGPEQPEEKTKWRAPGEGREDTNVVEEVKTGVAGASGGMLSAQSRPVIGPWARNEKEYKQSITTVFDRLIKEEVEAQYEGLSGVRDPKNKIGIESKIYSDPKELGYIIKDTIRDFISKDKTLKGTDFDDFARDHLNKLIAYRTGQEVEEETSRELKNPAVPEQPQQGQGTGPSKEQINEVMATGRKFKSGEEYEAYMKDWLAKNAPSKTSSKRGKEATGRSFVPSGQAQVSQSRSVKPGDELLTDPKKLTRYGFNKKAINQIQREGLTEQERASISKRMRDTLEIKAQQSRKEVQKGVQQGVLGSTPPQEASAPQTPKPAAKQTPGKRRGNTALNQAAKAILSGIERDKKARESTSQFFSRVRDLLSKQVGAGTSKYDIDQATASAINQQKARTTRNKTVNSAEYQEFAQSVRSLLR